MRNIFGCFILFIILHGCKTKPATTVSLNCEIYKTGKYIINYKPRNTVIEIDRQTMVQTEYDRNSDTLFGAQITWTGPCEYELKKTFRSKKTVKDSSAKNNIIMETNDPPPYKVRIMSGTPDYYVYEIVTPGSTQLHTDTAWVVKQK
ncbi:MAG: hypothetical protein E6H07_11820 [Bacteroidetes bacterium]|nr:MAG: hypothetical protein E6H07_11820 [Bacteroidota bacterium]